MQRIPSSQIVQKLQNITADQSIASEEAALYKLASLSDGSMRVAESLLDQILCFSKGPLTEDLIATSLAILPNDPFFEFDEAFGKYDLTCAFKWASTIFSSGKDLSYFLDCLLDHYRNILAVQLKLPMQEIHSSLLTKYKHSATLYTEEQTLYILDYLIQWHGQSSKTPFKRVSLEMILLHLLKSKNRVSAADLICRIEEMQSASPKVENFAPSPAPMQVPQPPVIIPAKKAEELPVAPVEEKKIIKEEIVAEPTPSKAVEAPVISPAVLKEEPEPIEEQDFISPPVAKAPQSPIPAPPKKVEATSAPKTPINAANQARYDTLMRFASVELEGLLNLNKE